jgi:hypothetical protein
MYSNELYRLAAINLIARRAMLGEPANKNVEQVPLPLLVAGGAPAVLSRPDIRESCWRVVRGPSAVPLSSPPMLDLRRLADRVTQRHARSAHRGAIGEGSAQGLRIVDDDSLTIQIFIL